MFLAILFYVGLGALIFYAIWGPKDQTTSTHQTPPTPRLAHNSSAAPARDGTRLFIAGGVVGLLVVIALAWAGGKYGSGNSLFPRSGSANSYQPSSGSPRPPAGELRRSPVSKGVAMNPYHNPASGIEAYDYGDAWIHVRFKDGLSYEYRSPPISRHHIEKMKHLADSQDDLNTYINQNRDVYEAGKPM